MNLQMIKSINGQNEYVLLPVSTYNLLKKQIDKALDEEHDKFDIEEYVQNPIALARISAGITQEDLAFHLEVTQAYISKVENQKTVTPKLLMKIKKSIETLSKSKRN